MSFRPLHDRVLVRRTEEDTKTAGGIIIPDQHAEKYSLAQVYGTLIAVGPYAFDEYNEKRDPFPKVGDRVMFAKYGGLREVGMDGKKYIVANDTDVTAIVHRDLKFTDLDKRQPVGKKDE